MDNEDFKPVKPVEQFTFAELEHSFACGGSFRFALELIRRLTVVRAILSEAERVDATSDIDLAWKYKDLIDNAMRKADGQ